MDDIFVVFGDVIIIFGDEAIDFFVDLAERGLAGDKIVSFGVKSPSGGETVGSFGTFIKFVDVFVQSFGARFVFFGFDGNLRFQDLDSDHEIFQGPFEFAEDSDVIFVIIDDLVLIFENFAVVILENFGEIFDFGAFTNVELFLFLGVVIEIDFFAEGGFVFFVDLI